MLHMEDIDANARIRVRSAGTPTIRIDHRATHGVHRPDRETRGARRRIAGSSTGFVNVQTLHTTTAIVVNEHEPLLLTDFECFSNGCARRRAVPA